LGGGIDREGGEGTPSSGAMSSYIEVVEVRAMHEVSDVIIDGKSLKEEAGRKTIHLSGSRGGTHNR
jgi:hypothetical protein